MPDKELERIKKMLKLYDILNPIFILLIVLIDFIGFILLFFNKEIALMCMLTSYIPWAIFNLFFQLWN